jgi:hypothetical protein
MTWLLSHDSASAGTLAGPAEMTDWQTPSGRTVGVDAAPEFRPKQNSALVGTTAGLSNDAPRREIGESQVRIAVATETCSGLDALLLKSLNGGASRR